MPITKIDRRAYYLANQEKMKKQNLEHYHNLPPEMKERRREQSRQRYANMTPEERAAYLENNAFNKRRKQPGNEWMNNLPTLREIRTALRGAPSELEVQYVWVPTYTPTDP